MADPSRPPKLQPGLIVALIGTYTASLGTGLSLGYPSASRHYWKFQHPTLSIGWLHVMLPIGALLGSFIAHFTNKHLGRNKSIAVGAANAVVSSVVLSLSKTAHEMWVPFIGILFMGIACGVASHTAPTYLHELSHHKRRGMIVSGHNAAVAAGLAISITVGLYEAPHIAWTCVTLMPFVVSAVLLAVSPASPLWLAERNQPEAKIKVALVRVHGPGDYAEQELAGFRQKKAEIFSNNVKSPSVYKPLGISIGLMFAQQSTGIGGFLSNVYLLSETNTNTIAFSLSHLLASLLAPFLLDRFGRTTMLHISSTLESIGLLILGFGWTAAKTTLAGTWYQNLGTMSGLCIFIIGYSLGHGTVPWVMMNELLPRKAKTLTTTASASSNWFFDTILTPFFTIMLAKFGGPPTFFVFCLLVVLSMVFVKYLVPETAGLTLDELEELFSKLFDTVFSRSRNNDVSIPVGNDSSSSPEGPRQSNALTAVPPPTVGHETRQSNALTTAHPQ